VEAERKTVMGSSRIKVTAAKNAIGKSSKPEPPDKRSPAERRSKIPVPRQSETKIAKFKPSGFFQNRKSNAHPRKMTTSQKRLEFVRIRGLHESSTKDNRAPLAETLKRYHIFSLADRITVL
jgi:hypothetical protein